MKSRFIKAKVGVFGEGGCNRAKWLYSREVVVFGQKWLYSCKLLYSDKLAVFG